MWATVEWIARESATAIAPDVVDRLDHLLDPRVADHQAVEPGRPAEQGEELLPVHVDGERLLPARRRR
jgi:hypothetical protein